MKIKPDVNIVGMRPELAFALACAADIWAKREQEVTVTSVVDGRHSRGSLHYTGCAADLRTRDLPSGTETLLADELRTALGDQFDVILERDHIHLEFQPKR